MNKPAPKLQPTFLDLVVGGHPARVLTNEERDYIRNLLVLRSRMEGLKKWLATYPTRPAVGFASEVHHTIRDALDGRP